LDYDRLLELCKPRKVEEKDETPPPVKKPVRLATDEEVRR